MANVRVCGDEFELIEQGNFTIKPNLSWRILDAGLDKDNVRSYFVVIPFEYDGAEQILKNSYPYPLIKSLYDKTFYVIVKGFPLEQIKNVLKQF